MNKLNIDILQLAKSVSDKLDHNSECGSTDFDANFRSPTKKSLKKSKVVILGDKPPNSLPKYRIMSDDDASSTHSSSIIAPAQNDSIPQLQIGGIRHRESESSLEAEPLPKINSGSETDDDVNNNIRWPTQNSFSSKSPGKADVNKSVTHSSKSGGESSTSVGKTFPGLTESEIDKFLSLEELSDEDELWLIMTPSDYKFKKQHVNMTGRQELKGKKFEIQFFKQSPTNNMVTLMSENDNLVTGPSFTGCVQISQKLQTFAPVYHECETKKNPIPTGLKRRYVPFGADIQNSKNSQSQVNENKKLKRKKRICVSDVDDMDSTRNKSDF